MKITLLTPMDWLQKQMLIIETAGRTCYQSYKGDPTQESASKFSAMILKRGHESVVEHSIMTVRFGDVSRGFTHQLVRHRLCAFSQESTRYVDQKGFDIVLPPGKTWDDEIVSEARAYYRRVYETLRKQGWKAEDARQFLPVGMANEIVVSANFRQWRHVFKERTAKVAHWEIREGMTRLLGMVQKSLSPIFDDLVPDGECSKGILAFRKE